MTNPIIAANRYLTLATSDNKGEVWVAPLAYVFDDNKKTFYFYSAQNSKHISHIAVNPNAAIAVFDSNARSDNAEGLQMKVRVEEVPKYELPDAIERKKWQRPEACFADEAPQRFYKIIPLSAFKNIDEDMVDYREEIDLG